MIGRWRSCLEYLSLVIAVTTFSILFVYARNLFFLHKFSGIEVIYLLNYIYKYFENSAKLSLTGNIIMHNV